MSDKTTALSFDASTVKPQEAISLLPSGWYICEIADAEVKATRGKAGGKRVELTFAILAGDYKGRKIFGGINVTNANPQAQEIGQRELSAICHATGVINVSDVSQFAGKQLQVKIKLRKASAEDLEKGYEDRNEPSGFKALEGGAVGSAPAFVPGIPAAPGVPNVAQAIREAAAFPPPGWLVHPSAPGYFYSGQEVKTEAELRAMVAPPVAVSAPVPAPPAPPAPVAAVPAPVAFPPAGWAAHAAAPGWFYNLANPVEMKTEADLKAAIVTVAPVAPPAGAGAPPPWELPA